MNQTKKFTVEINWKEDYSSSRTYNDDFKPNAALLHSLIIKQLYREGTMPINLTGMKVTEVKEPTNER